MANCRVNLIVIERGGKRQGFITNIPLKTNEIELGAALADFYRNRWQIETGYRVKEYAFRGKTCSKNYVIRYFYFMLSIILYDCWILADLLIIMALGLRTVKAMVTAKVFSAKLLMISIPYG
jgi:IS4 transposase